MNQPGELAEKIRVELDSHPFKSLISQFRNVKQAGVSTLVDSEGMLRDASKLSESLQSEIERCEQELVREKLVTSELKRLMGEQRDAKNEELRNLEIENSRNHDQLIKLRERRLAALQALQDRVNGYTNLKSHDGLTHEQHMQNLALAVVSNLPLGRLDSAAAEERWERIGQLVHAAEEAYVPLIEKIPGLREYSV